MENKYFKEIKGIFGFGCMRLPMKGNEIDYEEFSKMIKAFLDSGLNYFDTAHPYHNGKSEIAIRECLTSKYDRSKYLLTNKLTEPYFNKKDDIRPFFESQLKACGVDYFDIYLMHAQNINNYQKFKRCEAYEIAYKFKEEGLIKHFGISFHDKAEVLDTILNEHPEIEVVQIQLNYADWEDASVESKKVYDICIKHNKPMIIMEPVKGGSLVNLPSDADKIFRDLNGGSNASYALRFAASNEKVAMVLSGMSNMSQMNDNLSSMVDFKPLNDKEIEAIEKVCKIFKKLNLIPCTSCHYCVEENECPKKIRIPDMFSALNSHEAFHNWNTSFYYENVLTTDGHGKASDCIKCGKCEKVCPQHLNIRDLLVKVSDTFEKGI